MAAPITIAGNWKMNTSLREAQALAREVRDLLDSFNQATVILCPPFPYLYQVGQVLEGSTIRLGAQNMHFETKGAFTGEVSPAMLAELCEYVIIGHSERRQHFDETDELVNKKVKAAKTHGLRPILCVGETLEQRERSEAADVVGHQIEEGLRGVASLEGMAIAYEPVWAIGTGAPATPETAREMMSTVILRTLSILYGEHAALDTPLLYGGSVTVENVEDFAREDCVRGVLVGGVSLGSEEFSRIVRALARAKGLV